MLESLQVNLGYKCNQACQHWLATQGDEIVPGMATGAARRLSRHLARRNIAVVHGFAAQHIDGDAVIDAAGQRLQADVALWVTGAQAHAWPAQAGLVVDRCRRHARRRRAR